MKHTKKDPHPYLSMCRNVRCPYFGSAVMTALVNCTACDKYLDRWYPLPLLKRLHNKILKFLGEVK